MHNPVVRLVLGVGLMGAGGGLGLPQYPQAHSTLWDIFFMGGLGYLIIFLLLFISTIKRLKLINSDISKFLIIANYIFFINLFSATAAIYQPVLSFTFWMSVLYAVRKVDRVH
jgi:ABC-type multidrug transport system fused ATPase/permease subunit